jgi:beta-lactamase class A
MKLFDKYTFIKLLAVLLIFSASVNMFLYLNGMMTEDKCIASRNTRIELLPSPIAWTNTEEYLKFQKNYSSNYLDLRESIIKVLMNSSNKGHYGVYFEDLNSGAGCGVNEEEGFLPASLLKLPIMVAVLKKVEEGKLSLDKKVTLAPEDIDFRSGSLGRKGAGYQITIKEMLVYLIKESDNTAATTLLRFITPQECARVVITIGISPKLYRGNQIVVSPKQYSNILRSIYHAEYLNRIFSELSLSIMSETDYNKQLPAGVPSNINISHKYGEYHLPGERHGFNDCGIVFHPEKPYLLCVMSRNNAKDEAEKTISAISKVVYEYVNEKQNGKNFPLN